MSGELEAAGALATAGAAAGAIEGREPGKPGEGPCLNCGAALAGPFCSQCGQHAHPHRKLTHVFEEFLHGIVHFDTKAWRTLPMVAFRPGTLTRNYVYGKRARYISPIALFLFTIFFMFFVFAFAMPSDMGIEATLNDNMQVTQEDVAEARAELAQARAALEEARANPPSDEPQGLSEGLAEGAVRIAEQQVARLERQLALEQARAAEAEGAAPAADAPEPDAPQTDASSLRDEVQTAPAGSAGELTQSSSGPFIGVRASEEDVRGERWQDAWADAVRRGDVEINLGHPKLNEKARETLLNPDLALYKIQQAAYKFSFLLAPLSLPFIALLFLWKRGVTLYDHMAYALYALSFASLLFVAIVLTSQVSWLAWLPGLLMGIGLPVHTYFHLKGAYALGWFSALWRTFFMLTFALIILSIFITLILILGLAG